MPPSAQTLSPGADFWRGFWRLADPRITLTSVASIFLGIMVAATEGPIHLGWLFATAFTIFAIEVAKNATGDYYDYVSGADLGVTAEDRTEFSGGKRVLVDEILTPRQVWEIAVWSGIVGAVLGLLIVFFREPLALLFGLAGAGLAWSYQGPPLRLSYRGLGELSVAIVYGPLIALSAYLIQTHQLSADVVWLATPLGLVIGAFLWVNEFPDFTADKRAGKRNLVVILGKKRAAVGLMLIYLAAAAILFALPFIGMPATVWFGFLFALPAWYATKTVLAEPETFHRGRPVQPAALVAFLLYAAGAGLGLLAGHLLGVPALA